METGEKLKQALAAAFEILNGGNLSRVGIEVFLESIIHYGEGRILEALKQCLRDNKRLTPAAIIQRIEAQDGRPGPEEAWALVSRLKDEELSGTLTDEMAAAVHVSRSLHGDPVAARMAFLECYRAECMAARRAQRPIHWFFSSGTNRAYRADALREAVARAQITASQAQLIDPSFAQGETAKKVLTNRTGEPQPIKKLLAALPLGKKEG